MFKYSAEEDATRPLSLDESSALLPDHETAKSSKIVRQPAASAMSKLQNSLGIDSSPYESVSRVEEEEEEEEEDRLDEGPVRQRPRQKNRRQFTWRLLSVMAFAAFGFFAGVFVENLKLQSTSRSQDSSEDVCMDPIQALKPSSYLDSLPNGAVAADHIVCSQTGNEILQKGGNAVDAAVATALCLGVANPASSGLGGGAFLLIHSDRKHYESKDPNTFPPFDDQRSDSDEDEKEDLDKITEVIDCRETAPESASRDMFSEDQPQDASSIGGLAVAIPGELRGLELAHSRHGKLNWASVVEPAIHLARDGITISPHLARDIKDVAKKVKAMGLNFPELRRFLTMNHDDWDNHLKAGELLKNPQLAKTLEIIAKEGSKGFYTQQIAENLVNDVQSAGGIISMTDLEQYLPTLRSPLHADVNGYTIVGVPPPSSGGATIIGAARFLSGYQMPLAGAADTLSIHRMVEALRHAFAIRMSLSDPAFRANVTLAAVQDLVAGSYMESLRKTSKDDTTLSISKYGGEKWAQMNDHEVQVNDDIADAHEGDRRLLRRLARRFGYLEDNGTSHLSVIDKDGNAVAITTSVNQIFGSYVFSESTGVLLGNTMDGKFLEEEAVHTFIKFLDVFDLYLTICCVLLRRLWSSWEK